MKYALLRQVKDIRIEEKPVPEAAGNKVLVKIFACGICGTDILIYNGRIPVHFPYSPGHELSGVVESIGEDVKHVRVGDHVAVDPNHSCEFCHYCRLGYPHLCENLKTIKAKSNGGFAEYILVPEKIVYKIPDNISFEDAGLLETLSCCIHIIEETGIRAGDIVVIIGGGAMGLLILQLARQKGAGLVILSEPVEFKRKLALKLGADIVVDPAREDPVLCVKRLSRYGANAVIEGVGLSATIEQAFAMLDKKGTLILAGLCPEYEKVNVSPYQVTRNEITVKGAFLNPFSFARAVSQISKIDRTDLITGRYPLDAIVEAIAEAQKGNHVKVVIKPHEEGKA